MTARAIALVVCCLAAQAARAEAPRRTLARAVLAEGNFECRAIAVDKYCDDEVDARWEPLPDDAGLDNPCRRRELAVWALEHGALSAGELEALWPTLKRVFGYATPSRYTKSADDADALCSAVLAATAASSSQRLHEEAIAAALSNRCSTAAARRALTSLSPAEHRALYLSSLRSVKSPADLRIELMGRLATLGRATDLEAALRTIADDAKEDDRVAALAGVTLAELGDASRLPTRPARGDRAALERALKRLRHDPDRARREERLRAFLPSTGTLAVHLSRTEVDGDREDRTDETKYIDVADVSLRTLADFFSPAAGETVTFVWKSRGGKLVLVGIEQQIRLVWGCGSC